MQSPRSTRTRNNLSGRSAPPISAVDDAIAEVEREAFADLTDVDVAQLHALLARVRTRASDMSG